METGKSYETGNGTENGGNKTENRGNGTENGGNKAENRGNGTENGGNKAENRGNGTEENSRPETSLLDGRMYLVLPEGFGRMAEERVRKKFPYPQAPQEIFSDAEGSRIFTCSILGKPLREGQVYPALLGIQRMISHAFPESIKEPARTLRLPAGMAGLFMFLTGGMESDVCHYLFILPADGRMVFGGYHFPAAEEKSGREIFLGMLRGMRLKREDAGERTDDSARRIWWQDHDSAGRRIW